MRTVLGVALVIVCLGLAGCSLFGKKQAARKDNAKPFLGSEAPAKAETAALPRENGGPLPGANGLLAGSVLVEATERPIKASILIKNLDHEDAKGADLDVSTDDSGYFAISKLKAGENYLLEVRASENGELISRRVYVKPPNPALLIRLDRRFTTASTPPPPDMPKLRDKKAAADTEEAPGRHKPAVSIDPPVKLPDRELSPQGAEQPQGPARSNPSNIADGGFHRIAQPPAETITIPNPPPVPQQPQWESTPDQRQPLRTTPATGPSGSVRMPAIATPVPSCGLYGNRLDNFALYDLNGNVWEYKRDRRGRLTLLDFWYHSCGPCLQSIPKLVELQRDYGAYGLEIVSIACETGPVEEQRSHVRATRGRYGINYLTLLGGGPSCPVAGQFQVDHFPVLVLIDADGTIIWRSPRDGMDENAHYTLRKKINDYLVTRQSQP